MERKTISTEERNRILNKVRRIMENNNEDRLTEDEEEILKNIAGVLFTAYKKYIDCASKNELGGIENEQEL